MQNPISEQARAAALAQLDAAEAAREDILVQHIANGVVINSRTVQIDPEVVIAPGAVILAGTILRGKTVIGAGCVIGPNTLIEDSTVDEGTTVNASQIYGSHIGPHNNIGPFTHVRVGTKTAMLDIDADGDGRIVHGGESDEGGVVAARGLGRAGLATEGVGGGLHARQRTVEDGLAHAPDDGGIGGRGGLGEMGRGVARGERMVGGVVV